MGTTNVKTSKIIDQLPQSDKIALDIPDKFLRQLLDSGTKVQGAVISTLALLLSGGMFTPGMRLRPLPQDKSIHYFKAGLNIHITCNLERDNKGKQIVRLRKIKDHDNLGRNP
jgi:hypothetical protein